MNADSEVIDNIENGELNFCNKYNEDKIERSGSLSGDDMNIDNLKLEKEKIKRRRSSRGVYLSERKIDYSLQIQDSKEHGEIMPENQDEADNMDIDIPKTVNLSNETEVEIGTDNGLYMEIKIFEEKANKLKEESSAWKNHLKTRKHDLANARREYKDAKEGYTRIEESDLSPQHRKEMLTITHSRPDYSQYLKNVNIAYDKVRLTEAELKTVSTICKSIVDQSNIMSRTSYKILVKRTFGERKDPRILLNEFQTM